MTRTAGAMLIALACLAPASTVRAQSGGAPAGWSNFTRLLETYADSDHIIGTSALVMRDGKILARHNYGFADKASGKRVDDRSIFHWGSITKTLTALSIMQLRDRGKLTLDDKVTRWVPELREIHDPYGMIDSITIRMLLSHSAGFQNGTWPYGSGADWEPFEPTTWNQLVAMMPYQELHFRPGSKYSYSNPGFIYLARIIEKISGDPWATYVQKNLLSPLGLDRSYFGSTPYYLTADRSHNYYVQRDSVTRRDSVSDNGADFDPGITIPNGGWNAPLDDLATYLAYLTNAPGGHLPVARYDVILKRSSLEEMWKPVVPTAQGYGSENDFMGLSFFGTKRDGVTYMGHTGSQAGFRAFMYFDAGKKTAVLVAFNTTMQRSTPGARAAQKAMTDAALGLLK
ncbi:MAG TPA: serine hydrolase domain-containing protein [Gemmatimonadaceae bacterium]|nr:serine hydrolase domain-containing protein [Gemmatimonadaceae bacterium]